MIHTAAFSIIVYTVVVLLLTAPLLVLASTMIGLLESVDHGELIASYALEDGAVIVIIHQPTDNGGQLAIIYLSVAGARDDLRRIQLQDKLGEIQTEVCGGRLHLTYEQGDEVVHETVDVPSASLGFLPVVCKE